MPKVTINEDSFHRKSIRKIQQWLRSDSDASPNCNHSNNEWQISRCANLAANYDNQFLRLEALQGVWPQDRFCRALKTDLIKHGDYTMSVEIWNEQSIKGQNYGHVGLMFNFWDPDNYDFVYALYHNQEARIGQGSYVNGQLTSWKLGMKDTAALSGPTWNTLKVVVSRASKTAAVYLNARKLGDFNFFHTARGYGGVLIANGYENICKFRSFTII